MDGLNALPWTARWCQGTLPCPCRLLNLCLAANILQVMKQPGDVLALGSKVHGVDPKGRLALQHRSADPVLSTTFDLGRCALVELEVFASIPEAERRHHGLVHTFESDIFAGKFI